VVDLDDTLWGGVVGESGVEQLRLGGHDHVGEAYADLQRALKALTRRGVVLAIVSKNDEALALEAISSHPEMILRQEDFVAWRINWDDKASNIIGLVEELNLALDTVVFIDDSPAERDRVRAALPDVLVPDWPQDPSKSVEALWKLDCFDAPWVVGEDQERTHSYHQERRRQELRDSAVSVADWLNSLNIRVKVELLSSANLQRAAQLLNKTSQMNLATRRLTESELSTWSDKPGNQVLTFRVSDRLGDAGLVGVVGLSVAGHTARIEDFLLSCRVFGRRIEDAMLATAIQRARDVGCTDIVAVYSATERNQPVLGFLERSGLVVASDGAAFEWNTRDAYPMPEELTIIESTMEA
jgi:FkbH-like protein